VERVVQLLGAGGGMDRKSGNWLVRREEVGPKKHSEDGCTNWDFTRSCRQMPLCVCVHKCVHVCVYIHVRCVRV
jgi:hypothetical protein